MKVLVLMSTYNGERYLREQIDSILAQEGVDVYLLVRDDGSKDKTCEILDEYARQYENVDVVKSDNIGFIKSFTALLDMSRSYKSIDYYAFSDQDDIWYRNKLIVACSHLQNLGNEKPNLFTSNSTLINSKGNVIGFFHTKFPSYTHGNILIFGTEQGCSMVFNNMAVSLFLSKQPQISFHDRWMYLICFYLGTVVYDHNQLFKYRLHNNNTLANKTPSIINRLFFYLSPRKSTSHWEMAKEFYSCFKELLPSDKQLLLKHYLSYRYSAFSKLYVLTHKVYYSPLPGEHFFRMIIFNKI